MIDIIDSTIVQLKFMKMRAKLANVNHCAVLSLRRKLVLVAVIDHRNQYLYIVRKVLMLPGNPREDELINVLADLLAKVKEDGAEFADSKKGTNTFCSDNNWRAHNSQICFTARHLFLLRRALTIFCVGTTFYIQQYISCVVLPPPPPFDSWHFTSCIPADARTHRTVVNKYQNYFKTFNDLEREILRDEEHKLKKTIESYVSIVNKYDAMRVIKSRVLDYSLTWL